MLHPLAPRAAGALFLLFAACGTAPREFVSYGGMREVMRFGQTEPRAALQPFATTGCYGLGALAGLQGEILIDDGRVWVAREATAVVRAVADDQATLLVVANVPSWREVRLSAAVDLDQLETALAAAVPDADRSDGAPLPFVLEGTATHLAMHVVRGYCSHGEPAPGAKPPDEFTVAPDAPLPVRLVGVFAPGREGLLTHHGTALHVHALLPGSERPAAMGHVDSATVAAGAVLRVPANR